MENHPVESLRDLLIEKLERSHCAWHEATMRHRRLYKVLSWTLVISTVIVASEPSLAGLWRGLTYLFKVISVIAAIGAGLLSLERPSGKRQRTLESRDRCEQLLITLRSTSPDDKEALKEIRREFISLEERHHREFMY